MTRHVKCFREEGSARGNDQAVRQEKVQRGNRLAHDQTKNKQTNKQISLKRIRIRAIISHFGRKTVWSSNSKQLRQDIKYFQIDL